MEEAILQFQLNTELVDFINRRLPKGYSLQPATKQHKARHDPKKPCLLKDLDSDNKKISKENSMPKGLEPQLQKCYRVLQQLKRHEQALPFLEPVDPVALGIPDYHSIVKEPMDLSSVEANFQCGEYVTKNQFLADINKIWLNSYKYNQKGSDIYRVTVQMEKYFIKINSEEQSETPRPPPKKKTRPEELPLSMAEKRTLGQNIKRLPPKYLLGVWKIVSDQKEGAKELLEFDIETMPVRKCRALEEYVRGIMQRHNQTQSLKTVATPQGGQESSFEVEQND